MPYIKTFKAIGSGSKVAIGETDKVCNEWMLIQEKEDNSFRVISFQKNINTPDDESTIEVLTILYDFYEG